MAPKKQKPPTGYYRNSLTGHGVRNADATPQPKH